MDAQRLAAIPAFSTLSSEELSALATVAGEKEVDKGASVTTQGDFGHCVYAVEEGAANVLCDGETIGTVTLASAGAAANSTSSAGVGCFTAGLPWPRRTGTRTAA